MVTELRKAILVAVVLSAVLAACAPAQVTTEQVQSQVATQVAQTVQAEHNMAAAVAATLTAQVPLPTATTVPTLIPLNLPDQASLATATPFVVVPASGGSGGSGGSDPAAPLYSCSWREVKPQINQFKPGDPIDVVWVITNTGTKAWPSKKDLDYVSGTKFSPFLGEELPPLKPGDSVTVSFEANAPLTPGLYGMQFKVEGGLCWPALNIQVGKPRDP
jgi:type II secretory pathway component PulJ